MQVSIIFEAIYTTYSLVKLIVIEKIKKERKNLRITSEFYFDEVQKF